MSEVKQKQVRARTVVPYVPVVWRPTDVQRSLFMVSELPCPMCGLMAAMTGRPKHHRWHVHMSGDALTITEADDVHNPGLSFYATGRDGKAEQLRFRLAEKCPGALLPERFRPAAGIAELYWESGCWHLKVTGSVRADGEETLLVQAKQEL